MFSKQPSLGIRALTVLMNNEVRLNNTFYLDYQLTLGVGVRATYPRHALAPIWLRGPLR